MTAADPDSIPPEELAELDAAPTLEEPLAEESAGAQAAREASDFVSDVTSSTCTRSG